MQNIESSSVLLTRAVRQSDGARYSSSVFAALFLSFCLFSALLISWKPLQLSIITVFLFAGPHNWMEFRFFLGRMPARWGKLRLFYSVSLGGVALLTLAYITLYALGQSWYLNDAAWTLSIAVWNSSLILWVCSLLYLRGRERRGRDFSWAFAVGFALCALAWTAPLLFSLGLVYLHPLIALLFFDRQLKRTRPQWRKVYHLCLAALPVVLIIIWTQLARTTPLPEADELSWRITQHAGAGILSGVSSRLLVATHVFLETIHYGVWLLLIPLAGLGAYPWQTRKVPLATHRRGWPRVVRAALLIALFAVVVLWAGFFFDYTRTRDIYFALAMAHVLAEAPFLIRLF
ncbi:MAG: hypothetical protein ICV60_14525 [Pyrinomonadaceae bacterium]|nr:hypothetical protein [Pyrinomonadaceae bacterium]